MIGVEMITDIVGGDGIGRLVGGGPVLDVILNEIVIIIENFVLENRYD